MPRGICCFSKPFSHGAPVSETINSLVTINRSTVSSLGGSARSFIRPNERATETTIVMMWAFMRSSYRGPIVPNHPMQTLGDLAQRAMLDGIDQLGEDIPSLNNSLLQPI